jgi:aryl-alcohol dehydrogenase-like predicted oxidoreductase
MKLALGTVQFGLDYGINNKEGKVSKGEVFRILEYAYEKGINILDTAYDYGDSEKVLGEVIKENNLKFKIISKLHLGKIKNSKKIVNESLKRLNSNRMYGYMFHNFESFIENPKVLDELKEMKKIGKIEKYGFSLYKPEEAEHLLKKNVEFDIIQVPYSIFDQSFSKLFKEFKKRNIEIYVRSVFLQGLMFKKPDDLKGKFTKIKSKIEKLNELSKNGDIPLSAICINFAVFNENIDKVVIGVDSLENLKENIKALEYKGKVKEIYKELLKLKEEDEDIILPYNWKK